jgi:hypothetical protein
LADFPDADWVIVRQKKQEYVKFCLETPHALKISQSARFWGQLHKLYSTRFDLLSARVNYVHEINFENIAEGNLSELNPLSAKIGIQFNAKRNGSTVEPRRWHHS